MSLIVVSDSFGGRTEEAENKRKDKYESRNDLNHPANTGAGRGIADMGIQYFLGLCAGWNCGAAAGYRNHTGTLRQALTAGADHL